MNDNQRETKLNLADRWNFLDEVKVRNPDKDFGSIFDLLFLYFSDGSVGIRVPAHEDKYGIFHPRPMFLKFVGGKSLKLVRTRERAKETEFCIVYECTMQR